MSKTDKLLKENGFTKQKWLSDVENKIIYENDKKNRFIIFNKRVKAVEVSTEHGFSNFIYPYDLEAITLKMQELRLDRRRR